MRHWHSRRVRRTSGGATQGDLYPENERCAGAGGLSRRGEGPQRTRSTPTSGANHLGACPDSGGVGRPCDATSRERTVSLLYSKREPQWWFVNRNRKETRR